MKAPKLCVLLAVIALPVLLGSCAGTTAISQDFAKYIGQRYPPAPPPLKEVGGIMIHPLDGAEYGLFEVVDRGVSLVWFMRLLARGADGRPLWQILGVLPLPRIQEGDVVLYASCGQSREYDFEMIAIAKDGKAEGLLANVRRAWRLSRRAGRFDEIAISGNECARNGFPNPNQRGQVMVQNTP